VTGTDTGVGKTQVSSAILEALVKAGECPFAFKPFESGVTKIAATDSAKLKLAAGDWQDFSSVNLYRFRAPVAPGIAARLEGVRVSWSRVLKSFASLGDGAGVVEGAGGLHVPLVGKRDVLDLIVALRLPVLVVARAGLGTINHTTLTLNALRARGCSIVGVVLNRTSAMPDASITNNRAALERRFPDVRFVGPIPYSEGESARNRVVRKALASLVAIQTRGPSPGSIDHHLHP
jgi:dethiobiotin synthetase